MVVPRPFLKWAGGKGQLLPELMDRIEPLSFRRYHEPFVGGGALFFELARLARLGRSRAFLSDGNPNLIDAYLGVQADTPALIALLKAHKESHCLEHYYATRAAEPGGLAERAARIIYLNRTCYNGLYRENSHGRFNVPMGRYADPTICDEDNLRAAEKALNRARVECRPFQTVINRAKAGDLVYFDPPYDPLSSTSSFTAYSRNGFGREDQGALADTVRELDRRGVHVLLSNSATDYIRRLYRGFTIENVFATRAVNSRPGGRGRICEVLVRNF